MLTNGDVREMKRWYHDEFDSIASIARTFGVSVRTIRRALELEDEVGVEAVLIDVDDAASLMGITRAAFYSRLGRGQIPGHAIVRTGKGKRARVQFHRARLLAALEKRAGR